MQDILNLVWITLLPFLELRASIPYGIIVKHMSVVSVYLVCVITNILLAPVVYIFLDRFVHLFFVFKPFEKMYHKNVEKVQKKIHKYVETYGEVGIAIFIAIPLPGSGVYSGALGAYILGMSMKRFMIAAVAGVVVAGTLVTLISLLGVNGFSIFIKQI